MTTTNHKASGGGSHKAPSYPAGRYRCPQCHYVVEIGIRLTALPVCHNHGQGKWYEMEKYK